MANPLSDFLNILSEGMQIIKCKYRHDDKKNVKNVELNISIATVFLNT